jgi:hypothetical protein
VEEHDEDDRYNDHTLTHRLLENTLPTYLLPLTDLSSTINPNMIHAWFLQITFNSDSTPMA